ncbi:MAG: adenosylcobinamide-GDP ribazoletransferase, partial [Beijerinckiaceae bacterium]
MTGVNPLTAMAQGVRFYSRLRVPRLPWEADPFAAPDGAMMARTLPFAALIIVAPSAGVLWLAVASGLPTLISATLTIIALTMTTGAFHEDGLADTADGFGGGATRERRLEIMKDSRVGTFGASALALGFILRIGALAHLLDAYGLRRTLSVFALAAILSR